MLRILDQGVLSRAEHRGAFMPTISQLRDGSLIGCQHAGAGLGAPDNVIEVLRTDDGKTWRNQGPIHHSAKADGWAYRGPHITETPDGRLVLTATRFEASESALFDPVSEALHRPEMLLFWSHDGGQTWSAPEVVPVDLPPERYTCNGTGALVQFSPDRWWYPFETWKPEGCELPPDQKAAAVISTDQGQTWGELTRIADDPTGRLHWWDLLHTRLPDGRLYAMLWTHLYGGKQDLPVHWVVSADEGRTWSTPVPTNLRGQVCCPIALADGRLAAIYNYRHEPQGVRVAISEDLTTFDLEHEAVVFDAGAEAALGDPVNDSFLAEHVLIGFGKPQGLQLQDGAILTCFWCTTGGVTHTRWVRLRA